MKTRSDTFRRHHAGVPVPHPANEQQEADFTAEGSPPPGTVASEPPVLPDGKRVIPVTKDRKG